MSDSPTAEPIPVVWDSFSEDDVRRSLRRSLVFVAAAAVGSGAILCPWLGWQTWLLFVVGAAVSATGVFEWMRMVSAIIERMDQGREPKPMFRVLFMFFLRLALAAVVLYASLWNLHGSVFALLAGLAASLITLVGESFRLMAKVSTGAAQSE